MNFMDDANQKLPSPIDINEIKSSLPADKAGPPTVIIRSEASGEADDQSSKVKFLKKIITTEILLNVLLVLVLVTVLYVSFVLRFDLFQLFNKRIVPADTLSQLKEEQSGNRDFNFRVMAAEPRSETAQSIPAIYITGHGVNLEKALQASPSGRLTVYGQLKNEVMGFLPYWVIPQIDQIDTRAITSISYFGLEVDGNGEIIRYDTSGRLIGALAYLQKDDNLDKFLKKSKNNKLKVYLTLKAFNQSNIVALTTSEKARERFVASALQFMESKSFDGLNIDFEYIGTPPQAVRDGFSALIINLYKTMKSQHPNAKLTVDTFIDAASATRIHDIPTLAQNSDGLVIMGYDFHTPNSSVPGPVAPMEGEGLSIKGLMASYLDKAPADKLILAVPYYGYDWPVKQANGALKVAGVQQQVKVLSYGELAEAAKNARIFWHDNAQVPWYSYQDSQSKQNRIVYFENVRSLGIKYDYVKQHKLQGVAIWALGFDGRRTELNQTLIDKFAE